MAGYRAYRRLGACGGSRPPRRVVESGDRFGHRAEADGNDGPRTAVRPGDRDRDLAGAALGPGLDAEGPVGLGSDVDQLGIEVEDGVIRRDGGAGAVGSDTGQHEPGGLRGVGEGE
ncbi:hypothetical protein NOGI109294_11665 [Nocardiopsis gilva]